jgi:hypothetical protein
MGLVRDREPFARLTDRALRAEVTSQAQCADAALDPDEWFPVSTDTEAARREAAAAIAICTACPVREECLELSLRHWAIGQHGVWGGLVPAERAALRRRWPSAASSNGRVRQWRRGGPGSDHEGVDDQLHLGADRANA